METPALAQTLHAKKRALSISRRALGFFAFVAIGILADGSEPFRPGSPPQTFYQETTPAPPSTPWTRKPRFDNLYSQFEQPPQKMDLFQLEELQLKAAANRELTRKRVVLPPDAIISTRTNDLPPEAARELAYQAAAHALVEDNLHQGFLVLLLIVAIGLLAIRKYVPEFNDYMDTLLNPWTLATTASFERSAIVLEEEKSFSEFQAKFRVGPSAPGEAPAVRFDAGKAAAELFASADRQIKSIQKLVQEARLETVEMEQRKILRRAWEKFEPLQELLVKPELRPLEQMTCALEQLIKRLTEKAENLTSSTLRTVTQGLELLAEMCEPEFKHELLRATPLRFLVVDDETFSRYALSVALKRTLTEPDVAENVETALKLANSRTYDLIFLDVQMPGMDGFELCSKIHEIERNRTTPVVFVTSLRDFDSRAKSIVCGGRDLISKPFLTFELTVKTLTLTARERLHGRGRTVDTAIFVKTDVTPALMPEPANPVPAPRTSTVTEFISRRAPEAKIDTTIMRSKAAAAFRLQAKTQAGALRDLVAQIPLAADPEAKKELITRLLLRIHSLTVGAEACQQQSLAQIGAALEGLVKKLLENNRNVTASTLQAVSAAVGLIQELSVADAGLDRTISAPIRVLAVDDDPLARRFMTNALQLKFFVPQNAEDGKTAVELAAKQPFDVIFLDIQMPGLDGFAACHEIRQSVTNRDTPVVFVTSNGDPSVRARAGDSGAADFITKPYVCSELTLRTITFAFLNRLTNPATPSEVSIS
jgi:CheY-like chemotaxis protein